MFHLPVRFLSGSRPFLYFSIPLPVPDRGKYMKKPVHVSVNRAWKKGEGLDAQIERLVHHAGRFFNV